MRASLLTLILCMTALAAEGLEQALLRAAQIDDSLQRLQAYDQIAQRLSEERSVSQTSPAQRRDPVSYAALKQWLYGGRTYPQIVERLGEPDRVEWSKTYCGSSLKAALLIYEAAVRYDVPPGTAALEYESPRSGGYSEVKDGKVCDLTIPLFDFGWKTLADLTAGADENVGDRVEKGQYETLPFVRTRRPGEGGMLAEGNWPSGSPRKWVDARAEITSKANLDQ